MSRTPEYVRRYAIFWLTLVAFLLTIVYTNPIREVVSDDGFAYARTVRNLLATGSYQLDDWAAANPIFQTYWGALFARLFGYSISTLRASTLLLAFAALVGIYALGREHGLTRTAAGIVMLSLLACPLFLRLSFTFMTDVPFLALLILALVFYTRALRLVDTPSMLFGSACAASAILTRQLGIALIAGVFVMWLLDGRRRERALFYAGGVILPVIAALWQAFNIYAVTNWGAKYLAAAQSAYLAQPGMVSLNLLLRPAPILVYLALFELPFVLFALLALVSDLDQRKPWLPALFVTGLLLTPTALIGIVVTPQPRRWVLFAALGAGLILFSAWRLLALARTGSKEAQQDNRTVRRDIALLMLLVVYVSGVIVYGYLTAYGGPGVVAAKLLLFLPYALLLPLLPWNFTELVVEPLWLRAGLTVICALGAVLFARIFVLRYISIDRRAVPPHERLLDVVTLFLLGITLMFFQIGDEYFLVLLPFVLVGLGQYLQQRLARYRIAACTACVAMLFASAVWIRNEMAHDEAIWRGAEYLRLNGVPPDQINASFGWNSYYGLFDEYLKDIEFAPRTSLDEYFKVWTPAWSKRTGYLVTNPGDRSKRNDRVLVTQVSYTDSFFQEHLIQVWRTTGNGTP